MERDPQKLDELRKGRNDLENHLIDEFVSGQLSRREFVRRGSVIGLSIPLLGAIVAACGGANDSGSAHVGDRHDQRRSRKRARTCGSRCVVPAGAINPLTVADDGRPAHAAADRRVPRLRQPQDQHPEADAGHEAGRRTPTAIVWTFKLRPGVTFHNGAPDDRRRRRLHVPVAGRPEGNVERRVDVHRRAQPRPASRRSTTTTVEFHLEAPNGNFPYLVSSDNYNAIIVPKGTDFAKWEKTFIGTGPFKLEKLQRQAGRDLRPQPELVGRQAAAGRAAVHVLRHAAAADPGAPGRRRRRRRPVRATGRRGACSNDPQLQPDHRSSRPSTASCRCATTRRRSPTSGSARRSRYSLDRPAIVAGAVQGLRAARQRQPVRAHVSARPTRASRSAPRTSPRPSSCWPTPGIASGSRPTLDTEKYEEIPAARPDDQAGRRTDRHQHQPERRDAGQLLRQGDVPGNSDWLDATMSLVDYGDRGVPNVFLDAPLTSDGPWNAAHFKNPQYDTLVDAVRGGGRLRRPRSRSPARSRRCCSTRRRSSSRTSSTA